MKKQDAATREGGPAPVRPSARTRSGAGCGPARSTLPTSAPGQAWSSADILKGIVARDILPQLGARHRIDAAGSGGCSRDAARLARLLLADRPGFAALVAGARARGASWSVLADEIFGPAAQGLGVLWSADTCDILDVTAAMGWLQATTQDVLRPAFHGAGIPDPRSILLAPAPGETHGYGLSLAAGFFREAGWTVTTASCRDGDALAGLTSAVRAAWHDVLGLSLACDVHLPRLRRAVPLLRQASRNPDLRVIVGGALIARGGSDAKALGVEACIAEGHRAPAVASALLDAAALRANPARDGARPQPFP